MNVEIMAYTQLSDKFKEQVEQSIFDANDRSVVALTAIRNCYSPNEPSNILSLEGKKYFANKAKDGLEGTEMDRLFRHITGSKHLSTTEHINYTFLVEGVSRALLAQLTRHRHISFSVESQRYVKFGSNDKSGGAKYYTPDSVKKEPATQQYYDECMLNIQSMYDKLREMGIPSEDSRMVLTNGHTTNIVMTANLRSLLEFYHKRKPKSGAQKEISELALEIKRCIIEIDPWLTQYFE